MPPPSKAAIGTRITSYQLTISPLRTPPPRSPMPDPPFKPISIIIRRYIGTYLPGLDRILEEIISLLQERTPCDPRPIVACPSESINPTVHSKNPPSSTTTPSSSKFNFSRIMQGKLRQTRVCLSINYTCLEIPPARANPLPR